MNAFAPGPRATVIAAAAIALSIAIAAPRVYVAATDPEHVVLHDDDLGVFAPTGFPLTDAADARLRGAMDALNDHRRSPTDRYRAYREQLEVAGRLLEASLRSLPAQADAVSKLAAVRYELDPPVTDDQYARIVDMIAVASHMAPRVPAVQRHLGDLLLRMGRNEEALAYHRSAVSLDPGLATEVVATLTMNGMTALELMTALPHNPGVLAALAEPYFAAGLASEYLDLVDRAEVRPNVELLARYGEVAGAAGTPQRVLDAFEPNPLPGTRDEAERLRQLARARAALGDLDTARTTAAAACRLAPDEPGLYEDLGNIALLQGDPDAAIEAYQAALGAAARRETVARFRARMYRRIGIAEIDRGHADRAYDAFRHAVAIDPDEPVASVRLRQMREAAGVDAGMR